MSPLNFGISHSQVIIGAQSSAFLYVPVIPTTNLYAHWDMSLLSYGSGTTFTTAQTLANTSGTQIGAATSTPSLQIQVGSNGSSSTKAQVITAARSLKKALSIPSESFNQNYGSSLKSLNYAFPDGLSTWSYIVVWSTTSSSTGWQRPYRWDVPGIFFYDDFHASTWWWRYALSGEVNIANAGTGQVYSSDSNSGRGHNTNVHVDVITQQLPYAGSPSVNVRAWHTSSTGTINGGLNSPTLVWSASTTTGSASNRIFEVRPVTYTNNYNYPQITFYEAASYSAVLSDSTIISTINALFNKWKLA